MSHFIVKLFLFVACISLSSGLKCYICNSYTENGRITNKFCKDPGKFSKSRAVLKPCNSFKDAFNAELFRPMLQKNPKHGKYVLTCSKLTVSAGNFQAIERNCAIEEKILSNKCKPPSKSELESAKLVATELGASVQDAHQVELEMCHCNFADGCNPRSKNKISTTAFPTFNITEITTISTSTTELPSTTILHSTIKTPLQTSKAPKFPKAKRPRVSGVVKTSYDSQLIFHAALFLLFSFLVTFF